jgi:hypothetical protein
MATTSTYMVGSLPPFMAVRWALANSSWLAALILIVVSVLLAGATYAVLRRQAMKRSAGK